MHGILVLTYEFLDGELSLDVQPDSIGGVEDTGYLSEGQHSVTLLVVD